MTAGRTALTDKERLHASLEGRPVDRFPVASLYHDLYRMDHFSELTGLPAWRLHEWLGTSPERYLEVFAVMQEKTPFEIIQPHGCQTREWRERQEFLERDGHPYRHDRRSDEWVRLDVPTVSGHATDYHANETRVVFDRREAEARLRPCRVEDLLASGANDYLEALVARFGRDGFILSGGIVGTLFLCAPYVGLTNLYAMLLEEPDLIEYMTQKTLEQNLVRINALAAAGGDAIFIDDAMVTSELISLAHFERFSLPHMQIMVDEIHRVGHKAILVYYGGIADRLEQIAALGADGLLFECSMKAYVNDVAEFAERVGDRLTLFGNLDPIGVLQNGTDGQLEAEIRRQIAAGRRARGFIMSTASPITPFTPLARVQRFIEQSRRLGTAGAAR
jgi:uroporphyrinogen-III decarboxylase